MADVVIYTQGLVYASVCASKSLSRELVEEEVNRKSPIGEDFWWAISKGNFKGGEPNPCDCPKSPRYRRHWLLNC